MHDIVYEVNSTDGGRRLVYNMILALIPLKVSTQLCIICFLYFMYVHRVYCEGFFCSCSDITATYPLNKDQPSTIYLPEEACQHLCVEWAISTWFFNFKSFTSKSVIELILVIFCKKSWSDNFSTSYCQLHLKSSCLWILQCRCYICMTIVFSIHKVNVSVNFNF